MLWITSILIKSYAARGQSQLASPPCRTNPDFPFHEWSFGFDTGRSIHTSIEHIGVKIGLLGNPSKWELEAKSSKAGGANHVIEFNLLDPRVRRVPTLVYCLVTFDEHWD